ncbi:50S ribosomal protein L24 [Acetobacteraceae bacterium]|nr:50S ribosomal protein L24 [Acetobacteraceae bacterium]
MAARIKKDDTVLVITGKSRGHRGKVLQVFPKEGKAIVEGAALAKRHSKPNRMGEGGGIVEKAMPIDLSNLKLIDPKTDKPTKVGFRVEDGKKVRIAKATGEVLDV